MPATTSVDLTKTLKDAAYVTVGLGVLAVQQAQVRRRELTKQVESQLSGTTEHLQKAYEEGNKAFENQLTSAPAQKLGPLPPSTTERTVLSRGTASAHAVSSAIISSLSALRTSGRLSVRCSTGPSRRERRNWNATWPRARL